MNQVTEDANAQLEQLRRSFEEKVGLIKNNTDDELQEMADTAQKVLTEAGWDETGKQIVKGLLKAFSLRSPALLMRSRNWLLQAYRRRSRHWTSTLRRGCSVRSVTTPALVS